MRDLFCGSGSVGYMSVSSVVDLALSRSCNRIVNAAMVLLVRICYELLVSDD